MRDFHRELESTNTKDKPKFIDLDHDGNIKVHLVDSDGNVTFHVWWLIPAAFVLLGLIMNPVALVVVIAGSWVLWKLYGLWLRFCDWCAPD
ncbi:hypothetical protein ACVIGB_005251 [Bradyrhizobium sp. USDA 4341]